MISYLLFGSSKLLNISDITKRIGNFFKLLILLFYTITYPELALLLYAETKGRRPCKNRDGGFHIHSFHFEVVTQKRHINHLKTDKRKKRGLF